MNERVEIFLADEEGILIRAFTEQALFYYDGDPYEAESPLVGAMQAFYLETAPRTLLFRGFKTPRGRLHWENEIATPFGEEGFIDIGERLYLIHENGERWFDDYAYEHLSQGRIPDGWAPIERGGDDEDDDEENDGEAMWGLPRY